MSTCKARQESDQKVCHDCGLRWDMNDPEPPACLPESERRRKTRGRLELTRLKRMVSHEK